MKNLFAATVLLATLSITACQDDYHAIDGLSAYSSSNNFTFNLKSNAADLWQPITRGSLMSDGEELTDIWILDYQNGSLAQMLHQQSSDLNFGTPSLNLALGYHRIYFIASRGTDPEISITEHKITWGQVSDTFYKDYAITVEGSSSGNRTVTLDRVVTRLKLTIADAIKEGTTTFVVQPKTWYYGMDYYTGLPKDYKDNKSIFVDCPSSDIGKTNKDISIYGFSGTFEWYSDVSITATSEKYWIAEAKIENIPFKRNRETQYVGTLYSSTGAMTIGLNTDWELSQNGNW